MPFEPLIGTFNTALGKRLPDPPSDWPAPDRTYFRLKGFRYTSVWRLKSGFTYFWSQRYLQMAQLNSFLAKLKYGQRAVGTW